MIGRAAHWCRLVGVAASVACSACGAGPVPRAAPLGSHGATQGDSARPALTPGSNREPPPAAAPIAGKSWAFPPIARSTLPNGTTLLAVSAPSLPVIELRVIVHAGAGFAAPGVAEMTAELLRDGATKTVERLESLGANLSIETGFDATTFALAVTGEHADAAVGVLAEILQKPRFDEAEFKRLRDRKIDQAADEVRSGGSLVTLQLAMRALLAAPYANVAATSGDFAKTSPAGVRDFYKRFYGAKNITVVAAGAVVGAPLRAIETHFGSGRAPTDHDAAPEVVATSPSPAPSPSSGRALRVILCDRPKSVQSDVFFAALAPERHSDAWPALRVATQVLGGGVTSRLFADVRERRGLAYAVRAQIVELARGPQLFTVYAGTQTAKTAETVAVLLDQVGALRNITPEETKSGARFLHDVFAVRVSGVGALADLAATTDTLRLGDDYWNRYRDALTQVTPAAVTAAGASLAGAEDTTGVIVVSGDANAIEGALARFGEVTVVSPQDDFKVIRMLPKR